MNEHPASADTDTIDTIDIAAAIIAAYVTRNSVSPGDLPKLIADVHGALVGLGTKREPEEPETTLKPAVAIRKSVNPDFLVCLDDGKRFKSLKRHLSVLGMTPEEYRTKWGLPSDYPMVAPNYAATRSALAKSNGLGRKAAEPAAAALPKRRKAVAAE